MPWWIIQVVAKVCPLLPYICKKRKKEPSCDSLYWLQIKLLRSLKQAGIAIETVSLLCNKQVLTWKHIDIRLTMVGSKMKNYTFKFPTLPSWLLFRFGLILCQYLVYMTHLKSLQNAQPISSAATLSPTATDITNPKRDSTINAQIWKRKSNYQCEIKTFLKSPQLVANFMPNPLPQTVCCWRPHSHFAVNSSLLSQTIMQSFAALLPRKITSKFKKTNKGNRILPISCHQMTNAFS